MINEANADIVWVALGTSKQEHWCAAHVGRLSAPALIGVGAGIDFFTKRPRQAPLWMRRIALEWFFRLLCDPRRLWYRFLVYNALFVLCIVAQVLGLRKYQIEPSNHQQQ